MTDSRRVPMQYVAVIEPSKARVNKLPEELPVSFLPMESVGHGSVLAPHEVRPLGEVRDGYTLIANGDVAFAKISPSFQNRKGGRAAGLVNGLCFATTELTVLRPLPGLNDRFLSYVVQSDEFVDRGAATLHGVAGQQRVSTDFVRSFPVPMPAVEEQVAVADKLDAETSRIDQLIERNGEARRLLLERLGETISIAVTRGVDRDSPSEQADLGWAAEVREGWEVVPYQLVTKTGSGHTPSRSEPSYWVDCHVPWVTTGDVAVLRVGRVETLHDTKFSISELGMQNSSARLHSRGTVFLSRTASVGFSAVMGQPMATSQDFFTWTCGPRLRPAYLLYVLRAMRARGLFDRLMFGSTHQTIYVPTLMGLRGPLPPTDEQDAIVAHIRSESRRLFDLMDLIDEQVRLLRERRTAVITAAITAAAA